MAQGMLTIKKNGQKKDRLCIYFSTEIVYNESA